MYKDFQEELREYCFDVAMMESGEETLLREARARAETGKATLAEALEKAIEKRPHLAQRRELATTPKDAIFTLCEEIGGDLEEAVGKVEADHPELLALDDLYQKDRDLFEQACQRVGKLGGEYTATADNVIAKVLEQADRLRGFEEEDNWPKDKMGHRLSPDEIKAQIRLIDEEEGVS